MAAGDETDLVSFNDDSTQCILCDNPITVYSYGSCGHYICFVCASKMRVICRQLYCPVCRSELSKVYFSHDPPKKGQLPDGATFNEHGICFVNDDIRCEFDKLFENRCSFCDNLFESFQLLSSHISQEHRRAYCTICFATLKLFPFERRFYTREEFARHSITGDADDNSFTGHPLCSFCKKRFFDKDELYRHSTVEHFYCSFCAVDGKVTFYREYEELRDHFRKNHFLCEHPGCRNLELRSHVFQTEIELKAHVLECHTEQNKQARRQAGQVAPDYFFNFPARQGRRSNEEAPATITDHDNASTNDAERAAPCDFSEENFPSLDAVIGNGSSANVARNTSYDSQVRSWLAENLPKPRTAPVVPERPQIRPSYRMPSSCPYAQAVVTSKKFDLDDAEFPSLPKATGTNSILERPKWAGRKAEAPVNRTSVVSKAKPSSSNLPKPSDFPALMPDTKQQSTVNKSRAQTTCWSLKSIGQSLVGSSVPQQATAEQPKPAAVTIPNKSTSVHSSHTNSSVLKEEDFPQLSTSANPVPTMNKEWAKMAASSQSKMRTTNESANVQASTSKMKTAIKSEPANVQVEVEPKPQNNSAAQYVAPLNFDQRKAVLAYKIRESVGDNEILYESFKRSHNAFCTGKMSVIDFYNHCTNTVGTKALKTFIFELIALLPNIDKQQQLYQTVRMLLQPSSRQEKKTRQNRQMRWNIEPLQQCIHCAQLLDEADLPSHQRYHEICGHS